MKRILVFGCGKVSQYVLENNILNKENIVAFVDNKVDTPPDFCPDKNVIKPSEIIDKNIQYDYIIVLLSDCTLTIQIVKQLVAIGIEQDKVLTLFSNSDLFDVLKSISYSLFELCVKFTLSYKLEKNYDIVRTNTLKLCAKEIYRNNIIGDVAEAGVYKGDFAKHINKHFHDRKLYLYDTFEGFIENDLLIESAINNELKFQAENRIKDKNQRLNPGMSFDILKESIKNKMITPENVVFRKGNFPDTAENEKNLKFAFV